MDSSDKSMFILARNYIGFVVDMQSLVQVILHFSKELQSEVGGAIQPGNRFVSFVCAYARSGCLVETGLGSDAPAPSLFLFSVGDPSLFPPGQ